MTDAQPKPQQPPARKFRGAILFENGAQAPFQIDAFDHIGALAKLAAFLSDQPFRVMKLQFEDCSDSLILPSGRINLPQQPTG